MTYGTELADAKVRVGHREYAIYFHPTDSTIMIQRGFGASMGQSVVEGLSLGAVDMSEPAPIWRAAGDAVLHELGCRTVDVYTIDNDITWEASYTCKNGSRVSDEAVAENRSRWRAGLAAVDPMQITPPQR